MANNYRHSGSRIPVASASAAIASGALVSQEGFFGVALTDAASGASLWLGITGVYVLVVPAGVTKGDRLYSTTAITSDSVGLTLTETAALDRLVGIAVGDRDANGKALVLLAPQPIGWAAS